MKSKRLEEAALSLPPEERAKLAQKLLDSRTIVICGEIEFHVAHRVMTHLLLLANESDDDIDRAVEKLELATDGCFFTPSIYADLVGRNQMGTVNLTFEDTRPCCSNLLKPFACLDGSEQAMRHKDTRFIQPVLHHFGRIG